MIRYRSNDVMEMMEVAEKNPQTVVKRVEGRKEDFLYCKDGSRIMRLDLLFKGVKHVKMSQLIQDEKGTLDVCVVPEDDFNEEDRSQIEHNLIARIGAGNIDYCIRLITEREIRYTSRGKFKMLINQIDQHDRY